MRGMGTPRRREVTREELVHLVADESEQSDATVDEVIAAIERMGGRVVDVKVVVEEDLEAN